MMAWRFVSAGAKGARAASGKKGVEFGREVAREGMGGAPALVPWVPAMATQKWSRRSPGFPVLKAAGS